METATGSSASVFVLAWLCVKGSLVVLVALWILEGISRLNALLVGWIERPRRVPEPAPTESVIAPEARPGAFPPELVMVLAAAAAHVLDEDPANVVVEGIRELPASGTPWRLEARIEPTRPDGRGWRPRP